MASLDLTYDDIRARVGQERGYGRVIADWADNGDALAIIEDCVRDGARMFYTGANYEWSFLTPSKSMTLPDASTEFDLPADFGFIVDNIFFDDNLSREIPVRNEGEVLMRRQNDSTSTGRPMLAAVVAEGGPGVTHVQRFKLIYWPILDDDYDVQVRYSVNPSALGPSAPNPYGGSAHAKTLLEACLAASEQLDGIVGGPHHMLYMQSLEASKAYDRRLKPQTLGYNGNGKRQRFAIMPSIVTYTP